MILLKIMYSLPHVCVLSDVCVCRIDMWGICLEDDDIRNTPTRIALVSTLSKWMSYFKSAKTPQEKIMLELNFVRLATQKELVFFNNPSIQEDAKRKRLIFLFVKDLLDGVNGMILDHKDRQDNMVKRKVLLRTKVLAATFITAVCLGMLCYLYLFSMRQTVYAQNAWFNSFLVWLIFEILLISTGVVLVEQVVIPMWSMRSVRGVKQKIVRVNKY
jgi:hypothetical protein